MDLALFHLINNLAGISPTLDAFGVFCASALIFVMGGALLALFALRSHLWEQRHELAIILAGAVAALAALAVNYLVALVWFRLRPFAALPDVHQLIVMTSAIPSFPSDHTAFAFALATAVTCGHRKIGAAFLVAAAFVGLGRIFVGVHYPSDVLAGAVVGIVCGIFVWRVLSKPFMRMVGARRHAHLA